MLPPITLFWGDRDGIIVDALMFVRAVEGVAAGTACVTSDSKRSRCKMRLSITASADGQNALDRLEACLLRGEGLPDLILLDLNMPRLDGRGFLAKLRAREEFKALPVVVLTSSDAEQDIVKSYKLGASCYVNKPVGLDEFQKIVREVEHFWLTIVKLP